MSYSHLNLLPRHRSHADRREWRRMVADEVGRNIARGPEIWPSYAQHVYGIEYPCQKFNVDFCVELARGLSLS